MKSVQFVKDREIPSTWGSLGLSEFYASVRWEKESSTTLRGIVKAGDWEGLQAALIPEVVASREPLVLKLEFDGWPCQWSTIPEEFSPYSQELVKTLRNSRALDELTRIDAEGKNGKSQNRKSGGSDLWNDVVRQWVGNQNCKPCTNGELLLWLDLFPAVAPLLNAETFSGLWRKLFSESAAISADLLNSKGRTRPEVSRQELAWRFSLLFWSVVGGDKVQAVSSAMLERELLEQTDQTGIASGEILENYSNWLSPFIRAAREAQRAGVELFSEQGRTRFRLATHRALALCKENGEFLLSRSSPADPQIFLQQLLKAGDESVADFLLGAFPGLKSGGSRKTSSHSGRGVRKPGSFQTVVGVDPQDSPRNSFQSDSTRTACLRNYLSNSESKFAIAHHRPDPIIELYGSGVTFLKGAWKSKLTRGKKSFIPREPWANTCWNSDDDSEYFEMLVELPGGGRIDRQILIPRKGDYLLIADAVSKVPNGLFEHEMRIPIAPGLQIEQDCRSREYRLMGQGHTARLFPLGFPQSKVDGTAGNISIEGDELILRTLVEGTGVYVPVVIDWDASRIKHDAVWKGLTVTEALQKVPNDVAGAYRLKIGQSHQILTYRALQTSWEPRACLGFQTRYETAIGRINPSGDMLPLMYVE